jgi:hypothetical protein
MDMKDAAQIVSMLLETEQVRVCGSCEDEIGPMRVGPGQEKTHSYCKRHYLAMFTGGVGPGIDSPLYQKIVARPEDSFPPDLKQHPELVDNENREAFWQQKDEFRKQIGQQPFQGRQPAQPVQPVQ